MYCRRSFSVSFVSAIVLGLPASAHAQVSQRAATAITRSINENDRVVLPGNVHPAVRSATDLGEVAATLPFEHLLLQLKRSPIAQVELEEFLNELHNPGSPNFHRWGTAADFSRRFGLASADIETVKDWLQAKGFRVNAVYPNLAIDFSGTAGQVRDAFHAPIHEFDVKGVHHIANVSDPEIPAALAPVVVGPVALHDFKPHPMSHPRAQYSVNFSGIPLQLVVPLDLQTIYNLNPIYNAGVSGQGQTIVLLERTNLYSDGDWYTFRKTLGLARKFPLGRFSTVHPAGSGGLCVNPGVTGDANEATLDVEWASAAAPNANIVLASCADFAGFGPLTALQNLLSAPTPPPPIMSLSYGLSESEYGSDGNAYVNTLYQQAVFEGVTLFVSSGDAGADPSDQGKSAATHGINVNAFASTAYNVAVGGTDFGDTYLGENSTYWSGTNGPAYNSARSYIPEIPWSDSCASQLFATASGYSATFGAAGFCNSHNGEQFLDTAAAGGGPSACATGAPTINGVVSGSCQGYPKPTFQKSLFGNPPDGVRDLPDISLFAGNGLWSHFYVYCYSQPGVGAPCDTPPSSWASGGGTSFGTPIMAGVQALINQSAGGAQGNANIVYYGLAKSEYGSTGKSSCNSFLGKGASDQCVFYDLTVGDMDINCLPLTSSGGQVIGKFSCYYPTANPGVNGVLSTSNTSYKPAYGTNAGWDFASGIGTINAYNLAVNWPGSRLHPTAANQSTKETK